MSAADVTAETGFSERRDRVQGVAHNVDEQPLVAEQALPVRPVEDVLRGLVGPAWLPRPLGDAAVELDEPTAEELQKLVLARQGPGGAHVILDPAWRAIKVEEELDLRAAVDAAVAVQDATDQRGARPVAATDDDRPF